MNAEKIQYKTRNQYEWMNELLLKSFLITLTDIRYGIRRFIGFQWLEKNNFLSIAKNHVYFIWRSFKASAI